MLSFLYWNLFDFCRPSKGFKDDKTYQQTIENLTEVCNSLNEFPHFKQRLMWSFVGVSFSVQWEGDVVECSGHSRRSKKMLKETEISHSSWSSWFKTSQSNHSYAITQHTQTLTIKQTHNHTQSQTLLQFFIWHCSRFEIFLFVEKTVSKFILNWFFFLSVEDLEFSNRNNINFKSRTRDFFLSHVSTTTASCIWTTYSKNVLPFLNKAQSHTNQLLFMIVCVCVIVIVCVVE